MKNQAVLFLALSLFLFASCKNEASTEATTETVTTDTTLQSDSKLGALASGDALTLTPDLNASFIEWTGTKPAGGGHSGTIRLQSGEIFVAKGGLKSGNFVIEMNSLAVTDLQGSDKTDLEGHLKNGDFFDVAKHPTGTFQVNGVDALPAGGEMTHTVRGNLMLKGITKSISFPVKFTVADGKAIVDSPEFTINRTDWDIKYSSGLIGTAKDKLIDDDVKLKVHVEARVPFAEAAQ